jgi:hypothetical protein
LRGRVRLAAVRRFSGFARLLAACLSPGLLACATMRESVETQVLSSHEDRGAARHDPASDRIEVQAKLDGAIARVAVRIEPVCTTTAIEYRSVEVTRHRTPEGLFTAELVTFLVSAGVTGVATVFAVTSDKSESECTAEPACNPGQLTAATIAIISGMVAAVSGIMVGVDLLRSIPSTEKKTEVLPPRAQAAPCAASVSARPHRVALLFADGTESAVLLAEGNGVAEVPIPEDLQARFPDGISARIAVDGRVVGRLGVEGRHSP